MKTGEPVVQLLADLVAIPSMNPMGLDRTGAEYREGRIAEFVASYLRAMGADIEVDEVTPGRPNVIARIDVGAQQSVMLEAHLDTVSADNMEIEPFTPTITDGKLYGRGACDTKGSIASMLWALRSLTERKQKLRYNVVLVATADEEYRFSGARHAAAHGLRADFGIAGEPTKLRIVRAHKGVTRWRILSHGTAAHAAYPERGESAIYAMGHILTRLEGYARGLAQAPPHSLLGVPSLSVGVIEGGQAVNVVPDRCWIEVDRRTLPGEGLEDVLQPVKQLLRDVPRWDFEDPHMSVPAMEVGSDTAGVRTLSQVIAAVTGNAVVEAAPYATDAGIYNSVGIPTVVFGPGDIAQAHTSSEFIEIAQLQQASEILTRLLTT